MVPKWLVRKTTGWGLGSSDVPIVCSNIGDLDPAVSRIDGADADYTAIRLSHQGMSKQRMERVHVYLYLLSGRINDRLFISVVAYLPGTENPKDFLYHLTEQATADLRLTAAIRR
jgi:hypothetical protein